MTGKVLSIAQQKGGLKKTTLAADLAVQIIAIGALAAEIHDVV